MTDPLWTPDETRAAQTTLSALSSWLSSRTGKSLSDYDKLHRFSTEEPAEFWSALWDFTKISGDKGQPPHLADAGKMPRLAHREVRFRREPAPSYRLQRCDRFLGRGQD